MRASSRVLCTQWQSYRGKFVVTLALAAPEAIEAGNLKLKLGGVALGDSWISPKDFAFS